MKQRANLYQNLRRGSAAYQPPRRRLLSVLVAQALAAPLAAQAASVEVTSPTDNPNSGCTLREAIESVNTGSVGATGCVNSGGAFGGDDEVTFDPSVSGETLFLGGSQIVITSNVAINPGGSKTTINGNGGSRIFYSDTPNIEIDLERLVLTGGSTSGAGGAIRVTESLTLNLTNSMVSGNTADAGGGIQAFANANVILMNNSTVSGNTAGSDGGGIQAFDSTSVTLTNSTMSGNTAGSNGGGIHAFDSTDVTLTNSTVSGNTADNGGGIFAFFSTSVALTNSTVSGNTVGSDGGGIFASISTSVALTNSTVSGNTAGRDGGGVFLADVAGDAPTLVLTNSILADSQDGVPDCDKDAGSTVTALSDSIIDDDACGTDATEVDPGLLPLAANGGPTETHALKPGSPAIDAGDDSDCGPGLTIETDQRGVARDDGACDIGAYEFAETVTPIAFQDRAMGTVMNGADQWYRFDSSATQRISTQTNGFGGDTRLELYTGDDPKQPTNLLADDDDAGPEQFSNIRNDVDAGTHLIRVIGNPAADPFFLRLMSAEDILTFADAQGHFAATAIRVMSAAGITGGCGQGMYCPNDPVTRAQMALFLIRAIQGGNHVPPPATGSEFGDVGANSFGANAIEEFSTLGITAGCGGGNYCPDDPVTREQMAVFLLRALFGAGHTPPQATQAEISQFSDISDSFARDWIVQLVDEGITGGCGGNRFCPTDPVTRGQMAAFIQRTFDLDTDL